MNENIRAHDYPFDSDAVKRRNRSVALGFAAAQVRAEHYGNFADLSADTIRLARYYERFLNFETDEAKK